MGKVCGENGSDGRCPTLFGCLVHVRGVLQLQLKADRGYRLLYHFDDISISELFNLSKSLWETKATANAEDTSKYLHVSHISASVRRFIRWLNLPSK